MDLHATLPQPADPPLRLIQQGSKEHAMTHRSRLAGFIIDCETGDLDAAASFWSGALGMPVAERYAEGEAEYAELSNTPADLQIEVQKVRHPSRVHLDIETDDLDAEAARLEAPGARTTELPKRWWVMDAPPRHPLCLRRMPTPPPPAPPH